MQLGKYRGKVLCDIVLVDAFYLLLGILWKYDVEEHHDGRLNTYTINQNGEPVIFLPISDNVEEQKESNFLFVGERYFLRTIKKDKSPCFSLMINPKDKRIKVEAPKMEEPRRRVRPKEVTNLLDMYANILAIDISSTLPPVKEMNHNTDLNPREIFPNEDSSKLTPY